MLVSKWLYERNFYYADRLPICRETFKQNHINHQFKNVSGRFQSIQLKSCNIVDSRETRIILTLKDISLRNI